MLGNVLLGFILLMALFMVIKWFFPPQDGQHFEFFQAWKAHFTLPTYLSMYVVLPVGFAVQQAFVSTPSHWALSTMFMATITLAAGIQLLKARSEVGHEIPDPDEGLKKVLKYAKSAGIGNLAFGGWNVFKLIRYFSA